MATTYLSRTMGTPTNRKKFTISVWVKKSKVGSSNAQHIWNGYSSSSNRLVIYFQASGEDTLGLYNVVGGSATGFLLTNRKFRDTNGWYHIYYAVDTTQSTASDRIKLYVNGVQETSFSNNTYPSQNADMSFASGYTNYISKYGGDTSSQFDGSMSHFYYVDGSVIDIAQFGSIDSTTGEWKINTSPTISSYGDEGFLILKDGNTITDQSPNSNNFTASGTLTKTEDCPSNVFCTLNSLDKPSGASFDLSNGNTTLGDSGSGDNDMAIRGTIGAKTGKYYWEVKSYNAGTLCVAKTNIKMVQSMTDSSPNSGIWGVQSAGNGTLNSYNNGSFSNSNSFTDWSSGDIISMALDLDNGKLFFGVNGAWKGLDNNTANPANGTNPCFTSVSAGDDFITVFTEHRSSGDPESSFNFGNGYFGTSAISSEGSNASGIGKFEYDVPTGYTALSTKGLNE